MGGSTQHPVELKDCPGCGVGKAFMGSSEWGHWISCCSDKCGFKIKEIIQTNTSKTKYLELEDEIDELRANLSDMKHEGIPEGHVDFNPLRY